MKGYRHFFNFIVLWNTRRLQPLVLILCCAFFLTFSACHSYSKKVFQAREAFYCSNLESAVNSISEERKKAVNAKNKDVLKLEEAMIRLCQGNFRESETLLREVRDSFDNLENQKLKNNAEKAASMLADDCILAYPGEDYEKVMIRVMLALNSLMMNGEDVRAYANQINLKQEEIIAKSEVDPETKEKVKKSYRNLAIAPYLCGILDDENISAQQDQVREFTKVTQWSPNFHGGREMLERAKNGVHSQKGNGVVYVFALVGHGPFKREVNAEVTQAAMLISDIIISSASKHTVTPTIAPVPIPEITLAPCRYRAAKVTTGDGKSVLTEKITDINTMAIEQFEVNKPWIIARAAARRAVKKAGLYGVKEVAGTNSPEAELLVDLVGILWEASEEADTRCWNLLPGSIQVARLELPAGEHSLQLSASEKSFQHPNSVPGFSFHESPAQYRVNYPTFETDPASPVLSQPSAKKPFQAEPHTRKVWKKLLLAEGLNPSSCRVQVNVLDGRNTYVLVYFGDYGLIGEPHVSGQ